MNLHGILCIATKEAVVVWVYRHNNLAIRVLCSVSYIAWKYGTYNDKTMQTHLNLISVWDLL